LRRLLEAVESRKWQCGRWCVCVVESRRCCAASIVRTCIIIRSSSTSPARFAFARCSIIARSIIRLLLLQILAPRIAPSGPIEHLLPQRRIRAAVLLLQGGRRVGVVPSLHGHVFLPHRRDEFRSALAVVTIIVVIIHIAHNDIIMIAKNSSSNSSRGNSNTAINHARLHGKRMVAR